MKITYVGLGVRFGGRCPVCRTHTGDEAWERAETALYRGEGRYWPVHARCAGGRTKTRVGGRVVWRDEPDRTLTIEEAP